MPPPATKEDTMPKLTDTQLIILAAAAKRNDGSVLPLPKKLKLEGDAAAKVFKELIKRKLIAERPTSQEALSWRTGEDEQRLMLVVTKAGLNAIGVEPADEAKTPPKAGEKAKRTQGKTPTTDAPGRAGRAPKRGSGSQPTLRSGTKQAQVIELLRRPDGASIEELEKATGWQPHSVRGIIAGALKKKLGLTVTSKKAENGVRRYRIEA
jgi:hypothetical protein